MPEEQDKTATFTKGPWESAGRRGDFYDSVVYVPSELGHEICQCFHERGNEDECEANARLIAAAPDLLDSLKAAVVWLDAIEKRLGTEMVDLMPNGSLGRPAMLQAIAKAEGR